MIRTVNYSTADKVILRQKGWKWFRVILVVQILIILSAYLIA
ncbi:KGW motif small protein [Acinetobacter guillouiae]